MQLLFDCRYSQNLNPPPGDSNILLFKKNKKQNQVDIENLIWLLRSFLSTLLYSEIMPQSGIRAPWLTWLSTASSIFPPTFSK
jgi:hypothetical protein